MKLLDRYADYAIIGTSFLISMLIAISLIGWGEFGGTELGGAKLPTILVKGIAKFNAVVSALYESPTGKSPLESSVLTGLLSALAIAAVFSVGILVDIVSPFFFTPWEAFYFKRCVVKAGGEHMDKLFALDALSTMKNDYVAFKQKRIFSTDWLAQRRRYTSMFALVTTYCVNISSAPVLEYLNEKLSLWRMGRALGGSLFLTALVIHCVMIFPSNSSPEIFLKGVIGVIALWFASAILAMGGYMRLCRTLFSIIYLKSEKAEENTAKDAEPHQQAAQIFIENRIAG